MKFIIPNPFPHLFGMYVCIYFSIHFQGLKALKVLMCKVGNNKSEMRANQTVIRKIT